MLPMNFHLKNKEKTYTNILVIQGEFFWVFSCPRGTEKGNLYGTQFYITPNMSSLSTQKKTTYLGMNECKRHDIVIPLMKLKERKRTVERAKDAQVFGKYTTIKQWNM